MIGEVGGSQSRKAKNKASKKEKHNAKDYQFKMQFLGKVPLMQRLPKDQHPLVASVCEAQNFAPKEIIIKQGDPGDEFFVIREGEALVYVKTETETRQVATLESGDYFGENALLRDEPRTATIVAETPMKTFKIRRDKFQQLGLNDKLQFGTRRAVSGGSTTKLKAKEPTPKTEAEVQLLSEAIRNNENLCSINVLPESKIKAMVDVMWRERIKAHTVVVQQGDLEADYFYVIQDGRLEISCVDYEDPENSEKIAQGLKPTSRVVNVLSKGHTFGELALLYFCPRNATVKTMTDSTVWAIDRGNFKEILMQVVESKLEEFVGHLDNLPLLSALLANEKFELATALVELHFYEGENVVQQGEKGNTFFIMYQGTVNVYTDGVLVSQMEASVARGQAHYFGEVALLENEIRQGTVTVVSPTAKMLALDRDSFNELLGPLKEMLQKRLAGLKIENAKASKEGGMANFHSEQTEKIFFRDLRRVGVLGVGGFSKVELFEHAKTIQTYALKSMDKGLIKKQNVYEHALSEKNTLVMTNHPFIVKLHETYSNDQYLCILLEACLGGEVFGTYNKFGLHGSEEHARFVCASMALALEHLHERKIIYRDLKPENVLLTSQGYTKLTDFGLAKFVIGKTYTTCGTPEYFAPEVVSSTGQSLGLDWWSFGIMIFELMTGKTPFEAPNPMTMYCKICKGVNHIYIPNNILGTIEGLVRCLLRAEPMERLPMKSGGLINLRTHKWFLDFDWTHLKDQKLRSPFTPVVKSKKDLGNFFATEKDLQKEIPYIEDKDKFGWDRGFATSS